MTFREQSERMFAGVLVAAVLHGALLIAMHRLFDLRFEDYTRPLTVQLLAPEARDTPVREERPLPPKQEETAPAVAVPKPAPQPVATPRPAAPAQPAPERATAQEPAPVRTQPRTESAPAEASSGPVAAWTPAIRQSVESAPVRGGGGLNAVTGDTVRPPSRVRARRLRFRPRPPRRVIFPPPSRTGWRCRWTTRCMRGARRAGRPATVQHKASVPTTRCRSGAG